MDLNPLYWLIGSIVTLFILINMESGMAVLFIITNLGLLIWGIVITKYPFLIPVAIIGLIFWTGYQQKQEKKRHHERMSKPLE